MKLKLCLVVGLALASANCRHLSLTKVEPKRRSLAGSTDVVQIPNNQKLTFPILLNLIKDTKSNKVADVLSILGPKYPEYLKYNVMMYESESLQGASLAEPRVIVFGPEAKFIFSFNGSESQVCGNSIESISFDDQTKAFNFRSIEFKGEKDNCSGFLLDDEVEIETEQFKVSKANPEICMECHGFINSGPNWENYPLWPGAFGSNDDLMQDSADADHTLHGKYGYLAQLNFPRSQGRYIDLKPGVEDKEAIAYSALIANSANHPRYKWMHIEPRGTPANADTPYSRPNSYFLNSLKNLRVQQLISELKKRDLRNKWADIRWNELYIPAGTLPLDLPPMTLQNFVDKFEAGLGPQRVATLRKKLGPYKIYLTQVFREEFDMQVEKIKRMEKTFGKGAFQLQPLTYANTLRTYLPSTPQKLYSDIIGRPWTVLEDLAFQMEATNLPIYAALGYLLKAEGIDLKDYDVNRSEDPQVRRVIAFYLNDLNEALEYLGFNNLTTY